MSCSTVNLKDYFLNELAAAERREVESHLASCAACGEELDRLRLTQSALLSLRDEEIPRRIGFVSDKVFEPRWWQTLWRSPWIGFATAAALLVVVLVQAYRPVPAAPAVDAVAIRAELAGQVEAAVAKALAESEARQAERLAQVVEAAGKKSAAQREADLRVVQDEFDFIRKQLVVSMRAANYQRSLP